MTQTDPTTRIVFLGKLFIQLARETNHTPIEIRDACKALLITLAAYADDELKEEQFGKWKQIAERYQMPNRNQPKQSKEEVLADLRHGLLAVCFEFQHEDINADDYTGTFQSLMLLVQGAGAYKADGTANEHEARDLENSCRKLSRYFLYLADTVKKEGKVRKSF